MKSLTLRDWSKATEAPPLQGRGLGWGLTASELAELQRRARDMRRNPTEPEKRLWRSLSNSQVEGAKFRRQEVVCWFIADFACPSARLIVEVDGDTHDEAKDRVRDDILREHGYRVLRVTNLDVMSNMEGVISAIRAALSPSPSGERLGVGPLRASADTVENVATPHPYPSPEGEGLEKAQKLLGISLEGSVG